MKKIRIGQIGTGHLHAYKFGALRLHSDVFEIVGVAEDDPARREAAQDSDTYRGVTWMSSDELLAQPDLDAVLVEVEEHHTVDVAMRCIRAGKHIHVDKPGGESLVPFAQLLTEAEQRNLAVQMGYMYRNSPALEFCIKAVREGLLGELSSIDAAMNRYDGEEFRQLMKTFQGGAAYIFLCHLIDIAIILMGAPEKVIPLSTCTRGDGVVDNGYTVMAFPGGCTASLRSTIVEVGGFERRNLVLCGDKGTLTVQPLELEGNRAGGRVFLNLREATGEFQSGLQEISQPPLRDRYEDHLLEFAKIVRGEIENPYPYAHELLVQKCHLQACGYDA
ncbi:Gfo/Idh/MocA family oxidoreductase [Ruficoccus amylovorans]|uniref:Gfo/Idh/MocA family oxidoreductase n=1 Tax=Ruficoccus amylovorans TaxID=1804625 RepID=A0A842HHR5_9BACT|nr:Gfo/Idh/MocA family oxidoreductase [Ruficoccus amylovorans]MBC2595869.1 Gfo/Idh/MocA family oxidoreductase [Ruficoccus amylovorans]